SAGATAGAAHGQLIAYRVERRLLFASLCGWLSGQARQRTLDLLEGTADRDAEDTLAALEQVDDLLRRTALVDGGAVGDERDAGQIGHATRAKGVDRLADVLQRDTGVEKSFDHLEHDDVAERVQPLRPGARRVAHARDDQPGPGPVVKLAVADPGSVAGQHSAVTGSIPGTPVTRVRRLTHTTTSSRDPLTL